MKKNCKLYDAGILQVGDAFWIEEADIEDFLPEKLYVDLVNEAYRGALVNNPLKLDELPDGSRIVKRVEDAFVQRNVSNGHLNHYAPASALLRMKSTVELSERELSAVENLIQRINELLD